jgi:1-acyl-sn-glycerol-3-phosphate acyltransferase
MLAWRSEVHPERASSGYLAGLRRGAASLRRRRRDAADVVWCLRHLRGLRRIDWSRASRDPELIGIIERAFAGFYEHYFRMEVRGWGNIPDGRAILVGNHSGFGVAELLTLLAAWHRQHGPDRPVYALAHRWLYKTPFLRVVVPKIGGVPASWRHACRVLDAGDPLAIFPGGEEESTRPFSERYQVQLHGHRGFVRLAFDRDAPIVPFVTIGSHATMILPPGMHALAAMSGARRYLGLEAVPLPLQLMAWILGAIALDEHVISPATFLLVLLATPPLYPSKMTTVFGPPIGPHRLQELARPGEDAVDAGYRHIEGVMQRMMDRLAAERRSLFS